MPSDSYVFRVKLEGGDAVKQAIAIRKEVEKELGQAAGFDLGGIETATGQLKELAASARGVGRAMTAGFRESVNLLLTDIGTLQQQVNQVVRAGTGPVEEAMKELGVVGLDALNIVDTGSTQATQKMARLTTEIKGAQAQIQALQTRMAQLGAQPMVVPGSLSGEVKTVGALFKELTTSRWQEVRRMFRAAKEELAPLRAEIEAQAEALRTQTAPAYAAAKSEVDQLAAAQDKLIEEQAQYQRAQQELGRSLRIAPRYKELSAEIKLYGEAIIAATDNLTALRSIMVTGGMTEEQAELAAKEKQYAQSLEQSTVWWKVLTESAGEHSKAVEYVALSDENAAKALRGMLEAYEQISKLQTGISRGIGTMGRLGEKVELPAAAEGTLATFVIAERQLGTDTRLASDELLRQKRELVGLTKALDEAALAAQGLDKVQRAAVSRVQAIGIREVKTATPLRGRTVEEAGATLTPVLAQIMAQTEAIKKGALVELDRLEQEGIKRQPFGFLIRFAQKARAVIVGESIIPDMVTAINEWLAKIGLENPFQPLAIQANQAGAMIQTGLQERLSAINTDQAEQELKDLRAELQRTANAIESQLVVTGEASQSYKMAYAGYAAEVKRVRGEDPTAMGLLAQGKALKGTGVRGEFNELAIIDEGYQAIKTTVEERQRFSQEETAKLLELEHRYSAMRQVELSLDQELAQRKVTALKLAMEQAFETGDFDQFEALTKEAVAEDERLGEIQKELAYQRESVTGYAMEAAEEQLAQSKALAKRTIPVAAPAAAVGTAVAGEMIMPHITATQVKNVESYAAAIRDLGQAMTETRRVLPIITEAEQERAVAAAKAVAEVEEAEKRRTVAAQKTLVETEAIEQRLTATRASHLRVREEAIRLSAAFELEALRQTAIGMEGEETRKTAEVQHHARVREIAVEKGADLEVQASRRKTIAVSAEERRLLQEQRSQQRLREMAVKASIQVTMEQEKRKTLALSEEERRRTIAQQGELNDRVSNEKKAIQQTTAAAAAGGRGVGPTAADIARYGGGGLGTLSWAVQEAQSAQMGIRMLSYDIQYMSRSLLMAGAAMTGPPILAMKRFNDYTATTNRAARAMGLARSESDYLRGAIIDQSRAMALVRPEEMAQGLYLWATGVGAAAKNQAQLRDVIAQTIPIQKLAYMQQIELPAAVTAVAGIMAEFRMESTETERVVSVLDSTADRTFATVDDLAEAFKFVGPIAHDLGISMEEVAGVFGLLADANIRGSMAGRAFRQMTISFTKTSAEEDEVLNRLLRRNVELGETWRDLVFPNGKFIGLTRYIDLLAAATEDLTDQERAQTFATLSTANELPVLTALVSKQIAAREKGINVIRAEANQTMGVIDSEVRAYAMWEKETTGNYRTLEGAQESFNRKFTDATESENYQIKKLQVQWDAAMLSLGQSTMELALPYLDDLGQTIDTLTKYLTENPWVVTALLAAGATLTTIGVLGSTVGTLLRVATAMRQLGTMKRLLDAAHAAAAVQQAAAAAAAATTEGAAVAAAATTETAAVAAGATEEAAALAAGVTDEGAALIAGATEEAAALAAGVTAEGAAITAGITTEAAALTAAATTEAAAITAAATTEAGAVTAAATTTAGATTAGGILSGILGTAGTILSGAAAVLAGVGLTVGGLLVGFLGATGLVDLLRLAKGEELLGPLESLNLLWDSIRGSIALTVGTGGGIASWIMGEDAVEQAEAFDRAAFEAAKTLGLIDKNLQWIDQNTQAVTASVEELPADTEAWRKELRDGGDDMENMKKQTERAADEARRLGDNLEQLPALTGLGLAAFSEAELQAIDELEDYLKRRNEMVEDQNEDLAKMARGYAKEDRDAEAKYLADRAKLEAELGAVQEEPLWRTGEEAQRAAKAEAKALKDYQQSVERATADHLKKLADMALDHDDKMEDLEAARDAKGIIQEQRRYSRQVRDEEDQFGEQLTDLQTRLEETRQEERTKLEETRQERRKDLQDKLAELDATYAQEKAGRQADYQEKVAEKKLQGQQDLIDLEQSHAEKLAKIMGWEDEIRQQLRLKYVDRAADLRAHLAEMEKIYAAMYDLATQPAAVPAVGTLAPREASATAWAAHGLTRTTRRRQAGGYADYGSYVLGETGREFVLSSGTTGALERAIGTLTQQRVAGLATQEGYNRLDIRVTADRHFSPDFAEQTEEMVRQQIATLADRVSRNRPGAYRQ